MEIYFANLIMFIIVILIGILFTQFIWNSIVPEVFGAKELTFLQTFGLLILANIIFGSHCTIGYIPGDNTY
jgi:hypothetical protein